MTPLRVAVAGVGTMGRHHLRVLLERPDVEVAAIIDPAGAPPGANQGITVAGSVEEALPIGIDACVIAVPTDEHESVAVSLARARVAALIEKPLGPTAAACARIRAAFEEAGVPGCVGHVERFNPAIRALRERLEADDLGDVFQVATRRQGPFPDRIRDVGVVKDLATHDIDLTAWVAGSPHASVAARTAHRAGRPHEDMVVVAGLLENGTIVSHLVNWLTPFKERRVVVTGERGCLVADTLTADLTKYSNASVPTQWDAIGSFRGVSEGDVTRFAIPKPEPIAVEIDQFLRLVRSEPADVVTFADGQRTVAVAEAILRASEQGETVAVERAPS